MDDIMKMVRYCFWLLLVVGWTTTSQGQNTIFWAVKDTVSGHQSYLLGTYHQLGNHFADSLKLVTSKLLVADLAIFESLGSPSGVRDLINARPASDEWQNTLKRKDVEFLEDYAASWPVNIDKVRPGELYYKLQQDYASRRCGGVRPDDTWDHFDNYLIHLRDSLGLPNKGLETDSLQTELIQADLKSADWKVFRKPLHQWIKLHRNEKTDPRRCGFQEQYRSMNLNYHLDESCPDNVLISQRNATWMESLPRLLRTQSCFVAVGLLHLYNSCGLVSALKDEGFIVEPLYVLNIPE